MTSSLSGPRSTEPRPYEVFLSFRGEDTRNNIVSHLRGALDRRGIITYYDETNLQIGHTLPIELMKAIEESSIAIVVLSKNYASSTWCLRELAKIVECKDKLIIFPIFYDVDSSHVRKTGLSDVPKTGPSDVPKTENSFQKAFSLHYVNFKDKVEMVDSWREALAFVADKKGKDLGGRDEASLIEKIADKILWKLPFEASHLTESLVGLESRISDLKILINKNPDEVRFIGFWGMSGVGKTTTARAIFEEIKSKFDGSCFLLDVAHNKNEFVKLQQQLRSQVLNCTIEGIYDVVQGSSMIRTRLRFKKVLLVVDDVDHIKQLKDLAGHWSWFGKGSRIIITTKDEHLLKDVHDTLFVDTLKVKEALLLFRRHAFKSGHPNENYMKLSYQVLEYAGGLPLALEVLGEHLDQRTELFWVDTLERLKEVPEPRIISCLRVSFDDGLNPLQQEIFLYISCLLRGKRLDVVMECLRALSLHPEEGIEVLRQKSFIRKSTYGTLLEMHDLLQDMGQHIVRQRTNGEVNRYSYLWLEKDIKTVLLDYMGSAETEGIIMDGEFYRDVIESNILKEDSYMNMNKLKFLKMNKSGFGIYQPNLFQSSVQLPKGLKWLYWNHFPGKYLATHPSIPMNLVHIEMIFSQIESTPDFSHMPNLEVLDLSYSTNLVHIHPSLGRHMKIRRINLAGCSKLQEFPTIIRMNSINYLNLGFSGLQSFPEISGNVDSLEILYFNDTYIEGLPISIQYATDLQKLRLGRWGDDTIELEGLSRFKYLYSLGIYKFRSLTAVPELPSSLRDLEMLRCPVLKEYPKSFPYLLRSLEITHSSIERTPDFSHLPYLIALNLSGSSQLSEVHTSLGVHKKIEDIDLDGCINLKEFPTIVDMECLKTLNLSRTNLQSFPEINGNVDNLVRIALVETCLSTLPESIGRAIGLQILDVRSCEHLVLPTSLQSLEKLEYFR